MSKSVKGSSNRDPGDGMTRRTFLKGAAIAAAAGAAAILPAGPPAQAGERTAGLPGLNILVIQVDEMRAPSVYLPRKIREAYLPNLTRLADEGVDFTGHYIASSACVPSRATMATGLHSHQTAMFGGNIGPDLNLGFPTYGTMLRCLGYDTFWFGKWHLSFDGGQCPPAPYEAYGFTAQPGKGTCPDPVGDAYDGLNKDPLISQQFVEWLAGRSRNLAPWCATVSFVNPHDAALYPKYTTRLEAAAPRVFQKLPDNFESTQDRKDERKPALHQQLADVVTQAFGKLPDSGEPAEPWIRLLDTYVIFTSDHGDYTGSHGLRGKCYGMYEEAILVPLIVKDPTGTWTAANHVSRCQLTSQVDLVPLLLTFGFGSERWRNEPQYEHLSTRLSLAKILADPGAAGGPYAAHVTDEPSLIDTFGTVLPDVGTGLGPVPDHVMGVRMPAGKFAQYAYWQPGTTNPERGGMEFEGYDYRTRAGRLELHNSYGSNLPGDQEVIEKGRRTLDHAIVNELEAPLPSYLRRAQEQALKDWFKVHKETGRKKPKGG
jgi:arylsulfatase A-like enzyme